MHTSIFRTNGSSSRCVCCIHWCMWLMSSLSFYKWIRLPPKNGNRWDTRIQVADSVFVFCPFLFGPVWFQFLTEVFFGEFTEINWLGVLWHSYFIPYLPNRFFSFSLVHFAILCALSHTLARTRSTFPNAKRFYLFCESIEFIFECYKYSIKLIDCMKYTFLVHLFALHSNVFHVSVDGCVWTGTMLVAKSEQ